ncbi:MAG TPA: hypothetical protein VL092_08335 [Chitinophagaceae bacterium]|nr:hypothetical protein [Chitinophagaceae bacterium]
MQKINILLLVTGLLVTAAFSSCTKSEEKQVPVSVQKDTDINTLARGRNYVRTGIYYEGPGGMFTTCLYSGPACMVVVRPVIANDNGRYILTPDEGDSLLQVDKYKESGMETSFYSRVEVSVDQNGQETYHFTE